MNINKVVDLIEQGRLNAVVEDIAYGGLSLEHAVRYRCGIVYKEVVGVMCNRECADCQLRTVVEVGKWLEQGEEE